MDRAGWDGSGSGSGFGVYMVRLGRMPDGFGGRCRLSCSGRI